MLKKILVAATELATASAASDQPKFNMSANIAHLLYG
jgi:hypothetical protein